MEKNPLKKLTALLLSISMVFSMVTEAFPGAFAAGTDEVAPYADSTTAADNVSDYGKLESSREPGLYVDFLGDNRKYKPADEEYAEVLAPYIDSANSGLNTAYKKMFAPALVDQSATTNPDPTEALRTWKGYQRDDKDGDYSIYYDDYRGDETVFWVGVGVDRFEMLDLFNQEDNGIYSLELGFYYNSEFIEPYVPGWANYDTDSADVQEDYEAVIRAANMELYKEYQWKNYNIVSAETGLKPQGDVVTQEVISNPDMATIMRDSPDNTWRMTYVAIEWDREHDGPRFAGYRGEHYKEDEKALDEGTETQDEGEAQEGTTQKETTQYLFIIPFRLKKYGGSTSEQNALALRLARNAGMFSIGGSSDDGTNGVTPYAAWERTTTRNPGRELKLMANFQGDLDLFGKGGRRQDDLWTAYLKLDDGGATGENTATMAVDGDPSFAGARVVGVTGIIKQITHLPSGTGMKVNVERKTGYNVEVKVYLPFNPKIDKDTGQPVRDETGKYVTEDIPIPFTFKWDDTSESKGTVTFFIPHEYEDNNVMVEIIFTVSNNTNFNLYLDERHNQEQPANPDVTPPVKGNETVLWAKHVESTPDPDASETPAPDTSEVLPDVMVDAQSPHQSGVRLPLYPLPGEKIVIYPETTPVRTMLEIHVNLHADYYAEVEIYRATADPEAVGRENRMPSTPLPPGAYPIEREENGVTITNIIKVTESSVLRVNALSQVDYIVRVTYKREVTYTGKLEVWHNNTAALPKNVAQLVTMGYDDENVSWPTYSGVVYDHQWEEDGVSHENHSEVETDPTFRVLPWIEKGAAALSGSLGGDGEEALKWTDVLAILAPAGSLADLKDTSGKSKIQAYDLRMMDVLPDQTGVEGLRKNARGDYYAESEMGAFCEALWAFRQAVEDTRADPTDDLYSGLTAAQLQAYLLDYAEYLTAKAEYDGAHPAGDGTDTPEGVDEDASDDTETPGDTGGGSTDDTDVPPVLPVLSAAEAAAARIRDHMWYDPTAYGPNAPAHFTYPTTYPGFDKGTRVETPEGGETLVPRDPATLSTRAGRKMYVVLESNSAYTVVSNIVILDAKTRQELTSVAVTTEEDYKNVYSFEVPTTDYIVQVIYGERTVNPLDLYINVNRVSENPPDNEVTVTAYVPSQNPTPDTATLTEHKEGGPYRVSGEVLAGSIVTVEVKVLDDEYTAVVQVLDQNGAERYKESNITSDSIVVFPMLDEPTRIRVTYTRSVDLHSAYLDVVSDGGGEATYNMGYWEDDDGTNVGTIKAGVPAGEELLAKIWVSPGYYIASVEAYTADGAYAYTITGNGWNNGAGTPRDKGGPVILNTIMPNANYFVRVTLERGTPTPPEELEVPLTLQVVDLDNKTEPYANNYATATLGNDTAYSLGRVGVKSPENSGLFVDVIENAQVVGYAAPDTKYVPAGTLVTVEAVIQKDYELDSIVVEPSGLGITPNYISTTTNDTTQETRVRVQFVMPAASARVIVNIKGKTSKAKELFLHVNKTENGVLATVADASSLNTVTWVESDYTKRPDSAIEGGRYTITGGIPVRVPSGAGSVAVAQPGENVSFAVKVDPAWEVHSVTLTDARGNRLRYELKEPGDADKAGGVYTIVAFIMPDTDVTAIVNYRNKTTPDPENPDDPDPRIRDRVLELVVQDPDNKGTEGDSGTTYDNNWAEIVVSGATDGTIGPLSRTTDVDEVRGITYARRGDVVTISYDYERAKGYTLEVISVTTDELDVDALSTATNKAPPASRTVVPVYTGPDPNRPGTTIRQATFTMPEANTTVVVRFRKVTAEKPEQTYTANLVLHMPRMADGTWPANFDNVGEGTFGLGVIRGDHIQVPVEGDDGTVTYLGRYYSKNGLRPGDALDFTAWAKDGYYIQRVTVTSASLGVVAHYSGAMGFQTGDFVMPAADVQVNIFFDRLEIPDQWPKVIPYTVDLEVYGSSAGGNSSAFFRNISGYRLTNSDDTTRVYNAMRKHLADYEYTTTVDGVTTSVRRQIHEQDRITVRLEPDYAGNSRLLSVTVTDSRGLEVPWDFVPDGIAFDMPPAHVTVVVKFTDWKVVEQTREKHTVTLHVVGDGDTELKEDNAELGFAQLKRPGDPNSGFFQDADGKYVYADKNDPDQYIKVDRTTANGGNPNDHSKSIEGLIIGDILTLTATPDPDPGNETTHRVMSAYGVTQSGRIIPTTYDPNLMATNVMRTPLIPDGGQVQFAAPNENADVWVHFTDRELMYSGRPASLLVVGPDGSGWAEMKVTADTNVTTGQVAATGGGSIFVPYETPLTVDVQINDGFTISAVRVMNSDGVDVPFTWSTNAGPQREFNLVMPYYGEGIQVYVELAELKVDHPLTAQVVVNNAGDARNKATLRNAEKDSDGKLIAGSSTNAQEGILLKGLNPGDKIWLDIQVQTGYRIESIQVVPARLGIAPSLTKKNTEDQETSFTMRGEDVVVYVHFVSDGRTRRTVDLVTTVADPWNTAPGTNPSYESEKPGNQAYVTGDFSGDSNTIWPKWLPAAEAWYDRTGIVAAPATATDPAELVTVNYWWEAGSAVDRITVTDLTGAAVPFTQLATTYTTDGDGNYTGGNGSISFPMVNSGVTVTVYYKPEPTPRDYPAILHVIDMDTGEELNPEKLESWAKLTWAGLTTPFIAERTTGEVVAAPTPGNEATIRVPAGQTVRVDADPESDSIYLQAGYVLYREGGQMIEFNFKKPGEADPQTDSFIMYPGQNDVYIYFTRFKPEKKDYAAVLMLDSPEADILSYAEITRAPRLASGETEDTAPKDTVWANNSDKTHAYVTATEDEQIIVNVVPANGYSIESILMTPLGVSDRNGVLITPTRYDNTYTFTMPDKNVAILVKLRATSGGVYRAHLHYNHVDANDTEFLPGTTYAQLTNTENNVSIKEDDASLYVNEGVTVDLSIHFGDDKYTVLAAYVLRYDGQLVLLDHGLEGKKAGDSEVESDTFIMPAENVDVYVWFTKNPDILPPPEIETWHTAVLVVTDFDGTTTRNSGLNSARYWSSKNKPYPYADDYVPAEKNGGLPHWVDSFGIHKETDVDGVVRSYPTHGYFWVEEGETVTIHVNDPAPGYIFSSAMLTPAGIDTDTGAPWPSLTRDMTTPADKYVFTYDVGTRNSATNVHFVSSNVSRNDLTVIIVDRDNPGEAGSDENRVDVTPGTLAPLTLISTTSAGAMQIVPQVLSESLIQFTVTPEEGYTAVAYWSNATTETKQAIPLVDNAGSFRMPATATTLEIQFFKTRTAQLVIEDTRAVDGRYVPPPSSGYMRGWMTEDSFGGRVYPISNGVPSGFPALPDGTVLTANVYDTLSDGVTKLTDTRFIGAQYSLDDGATWHWLPPDDVGNYTRTIAGTNVIIKFIVGPNDPYATEEEYTASVSTVNLPSSLGAPTIEAVPQPTAEDPSPTARTTRGQTSTGAWTTARKLDKVTATLEIPYGYDLQVTVDGTDNTLMTTDVNIDGSVPSKSFTIKGPEEKSDGTVKAYVDLDPSMPARNVHISATYIRTRFTATVATQGNGGTADLWVSGDDDSKVTADSDSGTRGTITDLKGDETLEYEVQAKPESTVKRVMVSWASGAVQFLPPDATDRTIAMRKDDVTVTAIFESDYNTDGTHYLDLHVTGTQGGTATLVATKDGDPSTVVGSATSTPARPAGLTRIPSVHTGDDVTLTVAPINDGKTGPYTDYIVTVTYYLHNNGALSMTYSKDFKPDQGGTVTFDMPNTNTCIYVTFHTSENPDPVDKEHPDTDPNHYLDLHVSGTNGGTARLTVPGYDLTAPDEAHYDMRFVESTPAAPRSVSTIRPVATGKTVELEVEPLEGYTAMISYVIYNGGVKDIVETWVPADPIPATMPDGAISTPVPGGTKMKYTFQMPDQATCIFVTFRDSNTKHSQRYLDLHVSGTGGTATLDADGFGTLSYPPNSFGRVDKVEVGTPVKLTVTPADRVAGYTGTDEYRVTVGYYRHDDGVLYFNTYLIDRDNGGTATFDMPDTNTCIYVTFEKVENGDPPKEKPENPDPNDPKKYLDLHVSGTEGGDAILNAGTFGTLSSTVGAQKSYGHLDHVDAGTLLSLDVTPEPGYAVTVSYYVHNGGVLTLIEDEINTDGGGTATFRMPAQSTCVYVYFHNSSDKEPDPPEPPEPDPDTYIAYVTVENDFGEFMNKALSIQNNTTTSLNPAPLLLWVEGYTNDQMLVSFTAAPGYKATVRAYKDNGTDAQTYPVAVSQQGRTGACTAKLNMPGSTDVHVIITYELDTDVEPPDDEKHNLSLKLVGHDYMTGSANTPGNSGKLSIKGVQSPTLNLNGVDTIAVDKAALGDNLYLYMTRYVDSDVEYYIEKVTLESADTLITYTPPDNNVNEYGVTGTSLFTMPDGDALVTVYFRMNYKATLFVRDKRGDDFYRNGRGETDHSKNTTTAPGVVPTTTMTVTDDTGFGVNGASTTVTHTPIEGLYGVEKVTTVVDQPTLPSGTSVASVIAATRWGATNLTETATGSSTYEYLMSTPTRRAANVDITVILRDDTQEKNMYIATLYKDGDDGWDAWPDNWATITNATTAGLPSGTVPDANPWTNWTGAYEGDLIQVDVTTAEDYYAIVTAKYTDGKTIVSVLQLKAQGEKADPIRAQLYMPAGNVDVTVTYTTEAPKSNLILRLEGHERKPGNSGDVYDMDGDPGRLSAILRLSGAAASTNDPIQTDPVLVVADTNLEVQAGVETSYSVESITLTIPGFETTPIVLPVSAANTSTTTMPVVAVGSAIITVIFQPGEKSPRPFDPEHSTAYNRPDYPTDANPDLSENPKEEEGWILAENDSKKGQVTVLIPTLFDELKGGGDTADENHLHDAGTSGDDTSEYNPAPKYTFYWLSDMGYQELRVGTSATDPTADIFITGQQSIDPVNNTKGQFPKPDGRHWGYQLTLQPTGPASPFTTYVENGGVIYVTARTPNWVTGEDDTTPPTLDYNNESLKTQVVIPQRRYTVTLHIENHSSHPNPGDVSVTDGKTTITENGKNFEALGDATITTTVKPEAGVAVRAVIATDDTGTHLLSTDPDEIKNYIYKMQDQDVDITVIFDNGFDPDDPDGPIMYLAIVEKTGAGAGLPGNEATISNSNAAMLSGTIWTGIYAGDSVQVEIEVLPTYSARVVSVTMGGNAISSYLQTGGNALGAPATVLVDIPARLTDNVIITVEYTTEPPAEERLKHDLTLEMKDANASGANIAEINTAGPLRVNGAAPTTATETGVKAGTELTETTTVATGYLKSVVLKSGGVSMVLTTGASPVDFSMPDGDATVTVTIGTGTRTPRPHDNYQDPNFTPYGDKGDYPNYINGYLKGKNEGSNRALISVPNLYDYNNGAHRTIPAYDEPAHEYEYKLYLKSGGSYVLLVPGVDYDVVWDENYEPDPFNATTGTPDPATGAADPKTGWQFRIRSLKGESALTQLLLDGGVLYITATEVTEGNIQGESEYVEVVIPADPNVPDPNDPDDKREGYKATLKVVDKTDIPGNTAQMEINGETRDYLSVISGDLPYDCGTITKLRGDELIRTTAHAANGARISAVTVTAVASDGNTGTTAPGGSILLTEMPAELDPKRFPYYMTGEDVIITVYFEKANPEETLYIAAVAKYGAVDVPDNEAYIENLDDPGHDLMSGDIWAEGRKEDTMKVTVTLADGYYALIEAFKKSDGTPIFDDLITVGPGMAPASGSDPTSFTVEFDMPASDVQVNVTFVKELDDQPLRPYDPYRVNPEGTVNPTYEDHWIRAENRGDYLIVTVPLLNTPQEDNPTSVDGTKHRFQLHLQVDGRDKTSPIVNVTHLLNIVNVLGYDHPTNVNTYYDDLWYSAWDPTSPRYLWEEYYENEIYAPDYDEGLGPLPYTGARFIVEILPDAEIEKLDSVQQGYAEILHAIIDGNEGTMGEEHHYRMYITSDETTGVDTPVPAFRAIDYVDFEVPRYYSLQGTLESYAPQHTATFSLYRLKEGAADPTDEDAYESEAAFAHRQVRTKGTGLWWLEYQIKSSELLGPDGAGAFYKLVIEKPGHVARTWTGLELQAAYADDPDSLSFTVMEARLEEGEVVLNELVPLFAGDVNQDGYARMDDHMLISGYLSNPQQWSRAEKFGDPDWDISVFNPESMAHQVDIDGDGYITVTDSAIWNATRNFNKNFNDYAQLCLKNHKPAADDLAALIALTSLEADVPDAAAEPPGWPEIVVDPDLFPDITVIPDGPDDAPEPPGWPEIVVDPDLFPDFGVIPDDPEGDDDYSDAPGQGPGGDPADAPEPPGWPEIVVDPNLFPDVTVTPDAEQAEPEGQGGEEDPDEPESDLPGLPPLVVPVEPPAPEDPEPPKIQTPMGPGFLLPVVDETGENKETDPDINIEKSMLEGLFPRFS